MTIPESIIGYKELAEAVDNADAILFVVPTKAIRSVAQELIGKMNTKPIIIHASKGLEQDTHKRISEVLAEEIPEEKDRQLLYYLVLAMLRKWQYMISQQLQLQVLIKSSSLCTKLFMNDYFRIYTNNDVIGVETGAALKNIIAIGAGAIHGLGFGDDAKAAIMTRGLAEISRLGVAMGANPLTFIGLSGVGT